MHLLQNNVIEKLKEARRKDFKKKALKKVFRSFSESDKYVKKNTEDDYLASV